MTRTTTCTWCYGSGEWARDRKIVTCHHCGGRGKVEAGEDGRPWWETEFALPDENV